MGACHGVDFWSSGLLLNLTPGPDVYVASKRPAPWRARAGIVAALGITAGCFVHIRGRDRGRGAAGGVEHGVHRAGSGRAAYLVFVGTAPAAPG